MSWRLGFLVVAAIAAGASFLAVRVLREPVTDLRPTGVNPLSMLTGSIGLGLLALVLSRGRRWGWSSSRTLGAAIGAVVLIGFFVSRCRRDL